MAASALSKRLNISSPDIAYTMALFHNCGMPLLMQKYSNYSEVVEHSYANSFGLIKTVEQEHIKLDHAYIGGKICDSWNMPNLITQITLNHHDVEEQFADSDDTDFLDHLALIKMAENTAELYRVLGKQETDYEWDEIELVVTSHLGISADDYLNIRDDIRESILFK
jgi:HD-like signal output (HDOD) protein